MSETSSLPAGLGPDHISAAAAVGAAAAAAGMTQTNAALAWTWSYLPASRLLPPSLSYYLHDFWTEAGDARVNELPGMGGGPWLPLSIAALYVYGVKVYLPHLMKDRTAFDLRWAIRAYNLVMIVWNLYLFAMSAPIIRYGLDGFGCNPIDETDRSPGQMRMINLAWWGLVCRLLELLDTVFFIMRKKFSQVSNFHVFHHSSVLCAGWSALKFVPGGSTVLFPWLNCLVHAVMYTYYTLASFPSMVPHLWWKKHLTLFQIGQFLITFVALMSALAVPDCAYPRTFLYLHTLLCVVFLYLFIDFYLAAYSSDSKRQSKSLLARKKD